MQQQDTIHHAGTRSAGELHKILALYSEIGLRVQRHNNGAEDVCRRQKASQVWILFGILGLTNSHELK